MNSLTLLTVKKNASSQCLGLLQAVGAGKQRMRAEAWRQAQLLRAVVSAWEGHTLYKLQRQGLRRKAIRHRSLPELYLLPVGCPAFALPPPPPPCAPRQVPLPLPPGFFNPTPPTCDPSPLMPAVPLIALSNPS